MIRLTSIAFSLLLAFSLGNAQPKTPRTIESGRFRFYETKQFRGEETYEIRADARGTRADLIVLDANPLDNISNIRKVRYVVTQGRLFESPKLCQSVGFKP